MSYAPSKSRAPALSPSSLPADRSIICFALEDYWYHPKRSRRHYMERLAARGWRVLFVNSVGLGAPARTNPDFWMRVRRKLRSWARWLRRPDPARLPTFWVASPIALPYHGKAWARALNRVALRVQLRLMMLIAGVRRPVGWYGQPIMASLLGRLGERLTILHNSDKYDAYGESSGSIVAQSWRRLKAECDVIISASGKMAAELGEEHPASYHLPHGIDADHFSRARRDASLEIPPALAAIPRPRIGYIGQIEHMVDPALIIAMARAAPDKQFILIGPPTHQVDAMIAHGLANLHYLGQIPYDAVPAHMRGLDVGMMPLLANDWAEYANHLKMREYYLAGRPMVTIPHAEVREGGGHALLFVAEPTADSFLRAIDEALAASRDLLDPATMAWRADSATSAAAKPFLDEMATGTWEARTDELERIIAKHLGGGRSR
jgi:hypothetical protein